MQWAGICSCGSWKLYGLWNGSDLDVMSKAVICDPCQAGDHDLCVSTDELWCVCGHADEATWIERFYGRDS